MKLKFNDEFICTHKDGVLHLTSIYPDNNEIYKFKGNGAVILDLFIQEKIVLSLSEVKGKTGLEISQEDWDNFISFLVDQKIIH